MPALLEFEPAAIEPLPLPAPSLISSVDKFGLNVKLPLAPFVVDSVVESGFSSPPLRLLTDVQRSPSIPELACCTCAAAGMPWLKLASRFDGVALGVRL